MYSTSLCLVLVVALAAANGDKTQSVLREVVKGQLDVIKHCVGLRGYPYRGIPPHPVYPRKRYIVAFYARSSKDLNLPAKQVVVFDKVDVNKGGGYNGKDGTFKAPVSGVYVFQWTTLTQHRKGFITEFVVDDVIKGMNHAYAGGSSDYLPASQAVAVDMRKDQKAWLRIRGSHGKLMYGGFWSTFTGYLL